MISARFPFGQTRRFSLPTQKRLFHRAVKDVRVVRAASASTGGLILFSIVRNEGYFLPFFFDHYRSLGVENFFIYDDCSDDSTFDFLAAQPDCTIVRSDRKFGDSFGRGPHGPWRLPQVLKMTLPDQMFPRRWVLTVDADEFLILPSAFPDLAELTDHLDRIGQPYATAPMVEFYGETLDQRNYPRTLSPFEGNPYFDCGPYYTWTGRQAPSRRFAGIRSRLLVMLNKRYPEEITRIFGEHSVALAKSWKVPLLKHGYGVTRICDHEISQPPSGDVSAALAHFKFYPDLDAKIDLALREKQYYNHSMEYVFFRTATRLLGTERLVTAETRRYSGPQSMEAADHLPAMASLV